MVPPQFPVQKMNKVVEPPMEGRLPQGAAGLCELFSGSQPQTLPSNQTMAVTPEDS